MFLERERVYEFKEEFRRFGIILGSSVKEVQESSRTDTSRIFATEEAYRLQEMLDLWNNEKAVSWSVLQNTTILELACGSYFYTSSLPGFYSPHFARLCGFNGAEVIGLDILDQSPFEEFFFKHGKVDLVKAVMAEGGLASLPILEGKKFQIIKSSDFIGSNPDPRLTSQILMEGLSYKRFEENLKRQAGELLDEGGLMYLGEHDEQFNSIYYRCKNNEILRI